MPTNINNHWSRYYDEGNDFRLARHQSISTILSYLEPTAPKNCLDIGCGTGQLGRELAHRGYTVVGIDASESAIKIASSLTKDSKLHYERFDFERDDISSLRNQPYSLITCKLVYAFIVDKPAFLQNVNSLLARRGLLAIITPLTNDAAKYKTAIAVDRDVAVHQLKDAFTNVVSFNDGELTYFVCRAGAESNARIAV